MKLSSTYSCRLHPLMRCSRRILFFLMLFLMLFFEIFSGRSKKQSLNKVFGDFVGTVFTLQHSRGWGVDVENGVRVLLKVGG